MQNLIIDVYTKDVKSICNVLKKLKTTHSIAHAPYVNAPECSAIFIETDLTEEKMDSVLYNRKDIVNYIGVVENKNA